MSLRFHDRGVCAKVTLAIFLVAIVAATSACSFDRRKALAYDVLFAPDGHEREEVFYAALRERFKVGTPLREIEMFAAGARGRVFITRSRCDRL